MEEIIQFDKHLLLMLNGSDSTYIDAMALTLTHPATWIPLYVSLLYVVIRNNINWRTILFIFASAGLCVLIAGTVDDTIVKPLVARWRPTHDPQIGALVDVVNGYRGGNYGFFSAHAANTFSIALFFSILIRYRPLTIALVCYSLVNCWTRLYLGVHYPGDILVGLLWGTITALVVYALFRFFNSRWGDGRSRSYTAASNTSTGYQKRTAYVPVVVLILTFLYAFIRAYLIMDGIK